MGLAEGPGKGRELPLKANQYFHRQGGAFVQIIAGEASLVASGVGRVFGWAVAPKQADSKNAWKGSGTNAADKLFVIYADPENVFAIPGREVNASIAASWIGKGAGLCIVGATYALTQKAQVCGAVTASPLFVVDVDADKNILYVKVKQTKRQGV